MLFIILHNKLIHQNWRYLEWSFISSTRSFIYQKCHFIKITNNQQCHRLEVSFLKTSITSVIHHKWHTSVVSIISHVIHHKCHSLDVHEISSIRSLIHRMCHTSNYQSRRVSWNIIIRFKNINSSDISIINSNIHHKLYTSEMVFVRSVSDQRYHSSYILVCVIHQQCHSSQV